MMAQVNAGRVRFVGRGEYNNSTQYYVFDLVSYNGNSYYAKADTIGNLPTNTTYWQLVAEKGNVGPIGLTGNGISSIEKTSTSVLVDTYTITFTNGNTTTFDVTNGKGIDRIEKTATVGNIDTYTIYFNDNSTSTFEVANGEVTKEELQEEVDRLSMIYNLFPTTSDEDTEMTLDGTGEVKLKKIGLKGNTYQEQTTGKNLFKETGGVANGTYNNGLYTSNSLSPYQVMNMNGENITYIANTKYYISMDLRRTTGTGAINAINVGTTTGVVNHFPTISNEFQKYYIEFTPTSDYTSNKITVQSGNVSVVFEVKNLMVSTSSDTNYEPYTGEIPAPNPDYPQDIHVVSGDNKITVCGKNILKYPYLNTTSTVSGVTFTDNGNGSITINGTSTSSTYSLWFLYENAWNYNKLSFELNPGTYTFKGLTTNKVTMACNFFFSDNSNEYFSIAQNDVTKTITNKVRLNMRILVNGGTTVDNVTIYPQIEVGSSSSSFEPYNGNTYPINLPVENLFDDSTTTNILIADDGTEQVNSNIKTSTYIKVEPNTIYTCSSKLLPNKTLGWLKFSYYNASKNYLYYSYTDNTIRTITTSNNCEYIRIGYHTNIVNDVQFEVGSKANSYTPYGTTPIELCKIGDYQDKIAKSSGKNLFDKNSATYKNGYLKNDNGIEQTTSQSGYTTSFTPVKPSTKYTINGTLTSGENTTSFRLYYYDINKNWISRTEAISGDNISYTFTTPNNCYFIQFQYIEMYYDASTIMINEGETALPYEPYGKVWYLNKQIGKVVLDGSEVIDSFSVTGGNLFRFQNIAVSVSNISPFSNYFIGVSNSSSRYDGTVYYNYGAAYSRMVFDILTTKFTTVAEFKSWLSTHNLELQFAIPTSTITEITDTTLIEQLDNLENAYSYDTQTNITQTNDDMPFILDVEALMSLKNIFNS